MTDNEIIKALEYCKDCSANLNVEIIDLINSQRAEIERLQSMNRAKLDTIYDLQADTNKLSKRNDGEYMTCKDCIHFDVCAVKKNYYANKPFKNGNIDKEQLKYINGVEKTCNHFKEQSRLIELPCKVGDTVYDVVLCDDNIYRIFEMKITGMSIFGELYVSKIKPPFIWNLYLTDKYSYAYRIFSDIGKTVFFTKGEAKAKLKESEQIDNRA